MIEIGENTVIHPHAKIKAEHGNMFIGKGCNVSEKAVIGISDNNGEIDIAIGDGVSIESGAAIEARKIGDHCTIEVNAKVGRGAVLGKWCKIAPMCEVRENEVLEDYTVVFEYGKRRIDGTLRDRNDIRGLRMQGREKEIELLKTLIPDASVKWMS